MFSQQKPVLLPQELDYNKGNQWDWCMTVILALEQEVKLLLIKWDVDFSVFCVFARLDLHSFVAVTAAIGRRGGAPLRMFFFQRTDSCLFSQGHCSGCDEELVLTAHERSESGCIGTGSIFSSPEVHKNLLRYKVKSARVICECQRAPYDKQYIKKHWSMLW